MGMKRVEFLFKIITFLIQGRGEPIIWQRIPSSAWFIPPRQEVISLRPSFFEGPVTLPLVKTNERVYDSKCCSSYRRIMRIQEDFLLLFAWFQVFVVFIRKVEPGGYLGAHWDPGANLWPGSVWSLWRPVLSSWPQCPFEEKFHNYFLCKNCDTMIQSKTEKK